MRIITLQLKEEVLEGIAHDALNEDLSPEAFLEAWLQDWYDFTKPPSAEEAALITDSQITQSFERLRPVCDELMF